MGWVLQVVIKMTDYEKLGFKCGIEIHQQLDTKKLFCSCPSHIREEKPDIFVKRKMRVVAGELGNVDPAALYEFLKNREITYEAYSDTNCLVELDDEPPHELNAEALDIVLEVALLLNAKPVSELHVMRKTVIDGSNTGGFQRTMLVAMDGFIETSLGKVRIPTICLEEDAARKISDEDGKVTYRLDRLGIPLIEICTMPDIKSPEHAKETAELLGKILRATGKVKRGLGTIRQDLNVSISGGERIEVKGVQDLRLIAKVVENEVSRQVMLSEIRNELQKRGIRKEQIEKKLLDITEIFRNTGSKIVKNFLDDKGVVLAVKMPGFFGLLKGKLGPELAQYAKISKVKGIFHSDELPAYGISDSEVKAVREKLALKDKDAFALVAEKPDTVKRALEEVIERCKISFDGVPEETRRAREDGTTEFMRPLPGSERMYPETDEKFIQITDEKISGIKENLPKLPAENIDALIKIGLGKELATQLSNSGCMNEFFAFSGKYKNVKPTIIATTLIATPKEVEKKYDAKIENLNETHYDDVFKLLESGKITKESIPEILFEFTKNPEKKSVDILKEKSFGML